MAAVCATFTALPATAQMVRHADMDLEASGFVMPAGGRAPSTFIGGIKPVNHEAPPGAGYGGGPGGGYATPGGGYAVPDSMYPGPGSYGGGGGGYYGGSYCDSGSCDGGCDGMCDSGGGFGCGLTDGGLLGKLCAKDGMCGLRHLCFFCRGGGCACCQGISQVGHLAKCCLPYAEGGICAQRWYDFSAEALAFGHSYGGRGGVLTTQGIDGTPVMSLGDAKSGDTLEAGVRLSGSLIFGVASNLELTYMGGQEWSDSTSVLGALDDQGQPTPTLFSFISAFGTNPQDGFDDTDRSLTQSLRTTSRFHSGEWNYRRRTMGPYCRFQGSWLVGLRYFRFDSRLVYSALGEFDNTVNQNLPRFFSSNDKVKNNMFGPQAGFDMWWNVCAGVHLGFGMKGAWVQNDAKREMILTGNSLDPLATPGTVFLNDTDRYGTVVGEFETTFLWRFSHSWTCRTSYYAIAFDEVAFGTVDGVTARDFVTVNPIRNPRFDKGSLAVQGASWGLEYMW